VSRVGGGGGGEKEGNVQSRLFKRKKRKRKSPHRGFVVVVHCCVSSFFVFRTTACLVSRKCKKKTEIACIYPSFQDPAMMKVVFPKNVEKRKRKKPRTDLAVCSSGIPKKIKSRKSNAR